MYASVRLTPLFACTMCTAVTWGSAGASELNIKVQTAQLHLNEKRGFARPRQSARPSAGKYRTFQAANKKMDVNDQRPVGKPLEEIYIKTRLQAFKTP